MTRLAVAATLALAFALVSVSVVSAQGPDVQIVELDCNSDPEIVKIENLGDEDQEFAGWELQSDPPDSEIFDLAQLSLLQKGERITIGGVFKWEQEFVFRDDDPTDYARIVDNTGGVIHQVNCSAAASPTPSPADVPNGGGPPAPTGGAMSSTMMVLIGGSLAAVGVATLAIPRLRLRPSPAPRSRVQRLGRDDSGRWTLSTTLGLAAAALAVVFLLSRRHRA